MQANSQVQARYQATQLRRPAPIARARPARKVADVRAEISYVMVSF